MEGLQSIVRERLLNYLDSLFNHGRVVLNGQSVKYDIFRTIRTEDTIRKYIYMETEEGHISEVQLLDDAKNVLYLEPIDIQKTEDGLVLAFEFKLTVERKGVAYE